MDNPVTVIGLRPLAWATLALLVVTPASALAKPFTTTPLARVDELARNRGWQVATADCTGQARPQAGRVLYSNTYASPYALTSAREALDSVETAQIGFAARSAWKSLGRYQVRTFQASPDYTKGKLSYSFSLKATGKTTIICLVTWLAT